MNKTIYHATERLKKHFTIRNMCMGVLIVFCVLEVHAIFSEVKTTSNIEDSYIQYKNGKIVRVADQITVDEIQPWMTFNYVTVVFKLPPLYLKTALGITDQRYPNIQIGRYAKLNNIDSTLLIKKIQQAIVVSTQNK
ncbi:MAG: hypothetical protein WCO65_00960 [bacterium]